MQSVFHTYDYIDFKPYLPESVTFEPSYMLPGGQGCEPVNLKCDIDVQRMDDKTRAAESRMVADRIEIDITKVGDCTKAEFVRKDEHNAALGFTGVLFVLGSVWTLWHPSNKVPKVGITSNVHGLC